jgi:hypothetical protein
MDIEELKGTFVDLTDKALPEEDGDRFIECLVKREPYSMDLINHRVELNEEEVQRMLDKETKILERLKEERAKLLNEMDRLSKNRRLAKSYSPTFPFPSIPVFFDKTE